MDNPVVVTNGTFCLADETDGEPISGYETVDAVPHIDYYRNKESITGPLRTRPTLSDLHDHKVRFAQKIYLSKY